MAEDAKYEGIPPSSDDVIRRSTGVFGSARRKRCLWLALVLIILVIIVVVSIVVTRKDGSKVFRRTYAKANAFKNGAVASDSATCSKIGADIMKQGGNAVDSAVATIFCLGVINLHSCGIGGGGFMVAYIRAKKQFIAYDYREVAPASSSENMYVNSTKSSRVGGSAVAIPGNVKGLWKVHGLYGKLKWAQLLQPAIDLAENGFNITKTIGIAIDTIRNKDYMKVDVGLRKLLSDGKGGLLKTGDKLRNPALAGTLRNIQKHNATDFYEGELAKRIVKDVNDYNGDITVQDLKNYQVRTRKALSLSLPGNLTLTAMSAPSGGPIVTMIMNIMSGFDFSETDLSDENDLVDFYQKLVESLKFSYAQRGFLGDPVFLPEKDISKVEQLVTDRNSGKNLRSKISLTKTYDPSHYGGTWENKEDHGTAHLSVLAPNGDAVAATETINLFFGSKLYSEDTGILYNNEMDDFSTPGKSNAFNYPPSPANFIKPGKRPLSSMSPVIVTDANGDVRMVCGASGGSRIITGTSQVLIKKLFLNLELGEAVDSFRIHHQGIPNKLDYSKETSIRPPTFFLDAMRKIGHQLSSRERYMSVVQAIYNDGKDIYAKSDSRKGGKSTGF